MNIHVLCRFTTRDKFNPKLSSSDPRINIGLCRKDDPFSVRENVYQELTTVFGSLPHGFDLDFLNLALTVYSTDLTIPRSLSNDGWSRDFYVHMPVQDTKLWDDNVADLIQAINFLTGDKWQFKFRKHNYKRKKLLTKKVDSATLFSGGLDSLVGAIDQFSNAKTVALIGHYGAGITHHFQKTVLASLGKKYRKKIRSHFFWVTPPRRAKNNVGENSMRSRSLLFLGLGLAMANNYENRVPLYVPENGLISLNVPLTKSRSGSLSTRTTHPYFIVLIEKFINSMGIESKLILPYQFKTKGEMLIECKDSDLLKESILMTMSCAHPEVSRFEGLSPKTHCGYCIPCIIRFAATTKAKLKDVQYAINPISSQPSAK